MPRKSKSKTKRQNRNTKLFCTPTVATKSIYAEIHPFCTSHGAELTSPVPFQDPDVLHVKRSREIGKAYYLRGKDLLEVYDVDNPIILYAHPCGGKTSLMCRMIGDLVERVKREEYWVRLIDLKLLAKYCKPSKRPRSFLELCALYLRTPEKELRDTFKPLENATKLQNKPSKLIRGDLFLDCLDEMPSVERDVFIRALSGMRQKREECPIRIWILCRNNCRTKIRKIFGEHTSLEIRPYTPDQQLDFLFHSWKYVDFPEPKSDERLKMFAAIVHTQMEMFIEGFGKTFGILPTVLEEVADSFSTTASAYVDTPDDPHHAAALAALHVPTLLNNIAESFVEAYCFKKAEGKSELVEDLLPKEFLRIIKLHCKFAVFTFPNYEFRLDPVKGIPSTLDPKDTQIYHTGENRQHQSYKSHVKLKFDEEIFKYGMLIQDDHGVIRFVNKALGDFFIAKHFSNPDSFETKDPLLDRFFTRVFFFVPEARAARGYFDYFLTTSTDGQPYRPPLLRNFLINHYNLKEEDEWAKRQHDGNVFHLAVGDTMMKIALVFLDILCCMQDKEPLRRFLRMTAPIEIYDSEALRPGVTVENRRLGEDGAELRNVSSMSVVALFGYGCWVKDVLKIMIDAFGLNEVHAEFLLQGYYTPMHYAAMHSNLWFIGNICQMKSIFLPAGLYSPKGHLPIHLLFSVQWIHVMTIRDPYTIYLDDALPPFVPPSKVFRTHEKSYRIITLFREMIKDLHGKTSLFRICQQRCIQFMAGYQNLDVPDLRDYQTILHLAAQLGDVDLIRLILRDGVDLHAVDVDNRSAIHYAALLGKRRAFLFLEISGGRPLERDVFGLTAYDLWRECGAWNCSEPLENDTDLDPIMLAMRNRLLDIGKLGPRGAAFVQAASKAYAYEHGINTETWEETGVNAEAWQGDEVILETVDEEDGEEHEEDIEDQEKAEERCEMEPPDPYEFDEEESEEDNNAANQAEGAEDSGTEEDEGEEESDSESAESECENGEGSDDGNDPDDEKSEANTSSDEDSSE